MEFTYTDIEKLNKIMGVVVNNNSKSKIDIGINGDIATFSINNRKLKLKCELNINNKSNYKHTIELNAKDLIRKLKQFRGNKESYATVVNFQINEDKLIIYGNKHSGEIDIAEMGYKVTEKLSFELNYTSVNLEDDQWKHSKIHGSDEWSSDELRKILSMGNNSKGNIYIAGSKSTAFKSDGNSLTEVPINEYIGKNTILLKSTASKVDKILEIETSEKYYLNIVDGDIHLQNWNNTFKIVLCETKPIAEDLGVYDTFTEIDYDVVNINLVKHRAIDTLKRIMLLKGIEEVDMSILILPDKTCKIQINNYDVDVYNSVVSNELINNEIKAIVNINTIYKMIEQCDSDFVALDITLIGDDITDGIIVRISELDLEKYELAYEETFNSISHFELREFLNNDEHLKMRNRCLNRKCYTFF